MDIFAVRVQSLPQELYDQVYQEVFTSPPGTIQVEAPSLGNRNDKDAFKPPSCLQVNRKSREQFAQSFYANTVFVFDSDWIESRRINNGYYMRANYGNLLPWLASVSKKHLLMLRHVRFISKVIVTDPLATYLNIKSDRPREAARKSLQTGLESDLGDKDLLPGKDVVHVELHLSIHAASDDIVTVRSKYVLSTLFYCI